MTSYNIFGGYVQDQAIVGYRLKVSGVSWSCHFRLEMWLFLSSSIVFQLLHHRTNPNIYTHSSLVFSL